MNRKQARNHAKKVQKELRKETNLRKQYTVRHTYGDPTAKEGFVHFCGACSYTYFWKRKDKRCPVCISTSIDIFTEEEAKSFLDASREKKNEEAN